MPNRLSTSLQLPSFHQRIILLITRSESNKEEQLVGNVVEEKE